MQHKPLSILVTGARTYYALPVIRQLGRAGHRVTAADCHASALGFRSRYTARRWIHPSIASDPQGFIEALERFLRKNPHDLLLPLYEEAFVLSRYAERLAPLARLPLASYEQIMRFHDKRSLYEFARQAGVPIPKTQLAERAPSELAYPLVLKVAQSSSARGVALVERPELFEQTWRELAARHQLPREVPAIAQQHIDGEQYCTLSYAHRGEPKGTLVYRTLCEYPSHGGAGIIRESVQQPQLVRYAETLMRAAGWHGVIGFDFLIERGSGALALIDANPRPTPALLLARHCGLDLVQMLLSPDEPAPAGPAAAGIRTRIDPLVALWLGERLLPQPDYARQLRAALRLLMPSRSSHSDFFDRGDLHSLAALGSTALDLLRGAWGGRAGLDYIRDSQYCDYDATNLSVLSGFYSPPE